MVMVLGEVCTKANVNFEQVIREAVKSAGYDSEDKGLDWRTMSVIVALDETSLDLAHVIASSTTKENSDRGGEGDQGVVFGYATDETPEMMPKSHALASRLCEHFDEARRNGNLPWAKPGARAQVTMEYKAAPDGAVVPIRVHAVAFTAQQAEKSGIDVDQGEKALLEHVVTPALRQESCDSKTTYHVQISRASGFFSDTGLAGRKTMVDTYGGWGSHGDCAFSGKDGTKVCRSGSYGARWVAKSLVAARFCKRCVVQLAYSPGSPGPPFSVHVNSYGSAAACGRTDAELADIVARCFDLRPDQLQQDLGLKAPQFQKLSAYGHFGRPSLNLSWERPKDISDASH